MNQPMTAPTGLQILVVDDVAINRVLACALLTRLGHQVHEADGGQAAIDWLNSHPPVDVMLLDISMPDLNGEEVCRQLRTDPAHDRLKIVAYTAHAASHDGARYLANGFDAVLVKPISMKTLNDTIAALF